LDRSAGLSENHRVSPPDKKALVQSIIRRLEADLEVLVDSAKAAHDAATHEESKAEDKYDTRGLEASYLAGAQAKRAFEIQSMIQEYKLMSFEDFGPDASAAATALVEIATEDKASWNFLAFRGGGFRVRAGTHEVQVISVTSPLGSELVGRRAGDFFELNLPNGQKREVDVRQVL